MIANRFEDLFVWQKSKVFVLDIYKYFVSCRDYSFKDQIVRAAVSIMNNIAEGFDKYSQKDFKKFLSISRGSCAEVRSMLYLAIDLKYVNKQEYELLYNQSIELSKMLSSLINSLNISSAT